MKYFKDNIEKLTKSNTNFRKIAFTGKHSQLSLMSLKPNQDIGDEVHKVDQFFRVEQGEGNAVIAGEENKVSDGDAFIVPAGTKHNVFNVGKTLLKLYTIYSPPQHKDGVIHKTKMDALKESDEDNRAVNRVEDGPIPFTMYGAPTGYESNDKGAFKFLIRERDRKLLSRTKDPNKQRFYRGLIATADREIDQLNKGKNRAEENTMDNSYSNLQSMLDEGFKETLGNVVTKIAKAIKVPGEAPSGPSINPINRNMSTYVSGILSDQHKKEEKEQMSHPYSPRREDQRVDRWAREFRRDKNRVKAEVYGLKRGTKYQSVTDPDFNESCSYQNLASILNEVYISKEHLDNEREYSNVPVKGKGGNVYLGNRRVDRSLAMASTVGTDTGWSPALGDFLSKEVADKGTRKLEDIKKRINSAEGVQSSPKAAARERSAFEAKAKLFKATDYDKETEAIENNERNLAKQAKGRKLTKLALG